MKALSIRAVVVFSLLLANFAYADILGSFKGVDDSPGYIDTDDDSPWYSGITSLNRVDSNIIDYRSPSKIIDVYFSQGKFSAFEIKKLIESVNFRKKNAWIQYCTSKLPSEARDKEECLNNGAFPKLAKKWKKKKVNKIFELILDGLKKSQELGKGLNKNNLNTSEDGQVFLNELFKTLNIWQSFKEEDDQRGLNSGVNGFIFNKIPNYVGGYLEVKRGREEAANLLIPKEIKEQFSQKKFFSRRDIKTLKKSGYDLSKLDPPSSGMWRKPTKAIRKFDVTNYDKMGLKSLAKSMGEEEALAMLDPEKSVDFVYDSRRKVSGSTPKIYAKKAKQKWKIKVLVDKYNYTQSTSIERALALLINAAEVNVENVVNNLAAAIGFTVDPTYYKKKIRLFFDAKVYDEGSFEEALKDMYRDLEAMYPEEYAYLKNALKIIKLDQDTGRQYIELRGVGLEKKSDKKTDINVGFFNKDTLGRSMMREHRAFSVFLSWVDDPDIKDDNTKLKIIPQDDSYKVAYSNSDMGGALGHGMPNFFDKSFVLKVRRHSNGDLKKLRFNYRSLYESDLGEIVSFNDIKWLLRRISQFSLEQFERACLSAGFPNVVAKIFARKLMSRRNEMVKAFGYENKTILDDEGNPFTIKLEEAYEGFIPGYEKYFKDGYLNDPDNELFDPDVDPFPRDWSTYWTNKVDGRIQKLVWKQIAYTFFNSGGSILINSLQPGLYFTDHTLGFSRMSITDNEMGSCDGCFFQGVSVGLSGFVPFRFIVENPDKSSDKLFLVIDLFRFGFNGGTNFLPFFNRMGLNLDSDIISTGIGARYFQIYEFMKIRAVDNLREYTENYRVTDAMKLVFKDAKQNFVNQMKDGDSLVVSRYIGGLSRIRSRVASSGIPFYLGPEVTLDKSANLVSRVIVHKHQDQKYLVNWGGLKGNSIQGRLNLRMVLPLNLLTIGRERLKVIDRSYVFDGSSTYEKKLLLNNLTFKNPDNIPDQFKLLKRRTSLKQHNFSVGFSRFINKNSYSRKISADVHNYIDGKKSRELAYEREASFKKMKRFNVKSRNYTYKASIDDKNNAFLKLTMKLHQPEARKKHFFDIKRRIMPLVHDDYILFHPNSVKELLGDIDFEAISIISNEGLDKLFALDDLKVCLAYTKLNKSFTTSCSKRNYGGDLRLWAFMRDFKQGKNSYIELKLRNQMLNKLGEGSKDKVIKSLGEVVEVFSRYNNKRNILKVTKSLLPDTAFYHRAKMTSVLEGFPQSEDTIKMSPINQGKFVPELRHLAESTDDAFAIFSDNLVKRVSSLFFSDISIRD